MNGPNELSFFEYRFDRARSHDRIGLAVHDSPASILKAIDHRDAKGETAVFLDITHSGRDSFDVEHVAEV